MYVSLWVVVFVRSIPSPSPYKLTFGGGGGWGGLLCIHLLNYGHRQIYTSFLGVVMVRESTPHQFPSSSELCS